MYRKFQNVGRFSFLFITKLGAGCKLDFCKDCVFETFLPLTFLTKRLNLGTVVKLGLMLGLGVIKSSHFHPISLGQVASTLLSRDP